MSKILVLDNYDSFTYNLVHLLQQVGCSGLEVHRNDKIELDQVAQYDSIVLSPGPGIPQEAGIMPALVKRYASSKKILGVCLGHQCIGECFGGTLHNLATPVHGKAVTTNVIDKSEPMFKSLPAKILTGRYHSWVISRENFPIDLQITAIDDQGEIMALSHRQFNVRGVQFHPESILTEHGSTLMKNWLNA